MATTTNFGWETPDDTDLVKDGAAAIRTALGGVDTSFVDLKGGTTGQILSKASNTDLDYTWITNDVGDITAVTAGTGISGGGTSGAVTVTNSMATAIDAKGDLVPGTGADTFARLAVGTNYAFLQADSAQSTGLVWNNAAWTTYTPTVTATSGTFTTVSATGLYTRVGKLCVATTRVTITTNGTAAGLINVSAPFTAATGSFYYIGSSKENAVVGVAGVMRIVGGGTNFQVAKYDGTYIGGTGYVIDSTISYEVA